jgi:hypothetical protein
MSPACQRCGSKMILGGVCKKCGELLHKETPYAIRSCDYARKTEAYAGQKKYRVKPCRNCGRELWIVRDGLCGACKAQVYNPAKGIKIDKRSKKYEQALISYRKRKWPEKFGGGK